MPKQSKETSVESKKSTKSKEEKPKTVKIKSEPKVEKPESPKVEKEEEKLEKEKKPREKKPRRIVTKEAVNESLDHIIENASTLEGKTARSIVKELKTLRSDLKKIVKKGSGEKKRDVTNSGFYKEVKISDDLAKFMESKPGDLKSRVDVTRFICTYIKDKKLQDDDNKKVIVPDEQLKKLLKHDIKADGPLTFPGIQKLIQKHFPKTIKPKA